MIDNDGDPQEKIREALQSRYRLVFLQSDLGLHVLGDILKLCHFGSTLDPDNPVQVSEYNVGIAILHRLGILGPDTFAGVMAALANVKQGITIGG